MSSTAVDILIFGSVLLILGGVVAFAVARYWAQHVVFASQREHEVTRGHIDRVLECVEPEPEPEKLPIGFRPGA